MFLQKCKKKSIKERLESREQFLTNLRSPRGLQWLSAQNNINTKKKRKKKETTKQAKTSVDAHLCCVSKAIISCLFQRLKK